MKKILLWLLGLAGGLVVLLVAAILIIPQFIDAESYLPQIESKVAEVTGRSFSIGKDVNISVFPWVGASFTDLQLGNPEQFGGGNFVKVDSFEARVKLLPLLTRKIEIDKFVLNGPEIQLTKLADGSSNWTIGTGQTDPATQQTETQPQDSSTPAINITALQVGEFAVNNGRLVYTNKGSGYTREVTSLNLQLQDVSLETPIVIDFDARIDGEPVSLDGKIGPIGKEPGKGTVSFDLVAKAFAEVELQLQGEVVEPLQEQRFATDITISPFSPRTLLSKMGMEMPVQTADPSAFNNFSAKMSIAGNPTEILITESSVTLDESNLQVEAAIKEMQKPDLTFSLGLDTIDVDRYLPPKSTETSEKAESTTEKAPSKPAEIDYTPLRRLVMDGEITVAELKGGGAQANNILVKITGRDGVFELNPFSLDLYQGSVALLGNFNVQQKSPVSSIELKTESVQAGPLLQDLMNKDLLRGTMNADAKLQFTGDNGPAIKKSLNGSGKLTFLDGALVGIDIAETGRMLSQGLGYQQPAEKPTTDFAELNVPFTLTSGVFQTNDSILLSPLLRVNASGTANLVSEALDMKVRPKVVGTLKGQGDTAERTGVTIPLSVKGTFSQPKISADMSSLANEDTLKEALTNPDAAKEKVKSLEETGKNLLRGFGIGN